LIFSRRDLTLQVFKAFTIRMKRFYLPKSARLWCVFIGILALCAAGWLDAGYRERMARQTPLVDQPGYIATVETAGYGVELYAEAKQYRAFSIASLAIGILLFGSSVVSTSQKAK
jgi:hypothetical protein